MLVNGVDISMLEGWMIKINSNPSFFGKNLNRRWFKVGFVPGLGSEKKLVISYSSSKCVPSCANLVQQIVSPSRTLRLKGETAVEHRLWSDSLYKLCNPPPKSATAVIETAQSAEPRRERTPRRTQKEAKQADDEEDQRHHRRQSDRESERERRPPAHDNREREKRSARSNRQRDPSDDEESDRDSHQRDFDRDRSRRPRGDYDDDDLRKRRSSTPNIRESGQEKRQEREPSRHSPPRYERQGDNTKSRVSQSASSRRPSEHESSDNDSSEDDRADSPRPSTNSSIRSLLVAQIKAGSSFEADTAQCKNVISDSEDEDDEEYQLEKKTEDPEEESPREPITSSTNAIDDESYPDEIKLMNPEFSERLAIAEPPSRRKNSDYFDSDEENEKIVLPPTKNANVPIDNKVLISHVTADNNFVHDDWDAEEEEPSSPTPALESAFPV
ncbi:unnamed protein product [Phytophthora lilii]|uniref:Unnamed protein product n=1 Tax=Phytophthora lilii TaxID=2077276 RepID=A0A9W6TBP1_9STRA|nr:unnamed protein product [Phytophthora lilii]